ncbi:MAG TPA: acyl-CoA dehydrogenase family protein [Actinomycetaceae bacterium]|nr:acyl-CoA dehydrogenase family protein [Actinomycetaceae bacterium]
MAATTTQPTPVQSAGTKSRRGRPEPTSGAAQPVVTEKEARKVAEAARETGWTQPSFAKELYLGNFRPDLITPFPKTEADIAERGEAYLVKLRDILATIDGAAIEREARIPDEDIRKLAEIGSFGIKIPQEYGGLELGNVYYNRALMLIGTVSPALGALVSAHQSIGVPEPVKTFGSPEQKAEYLPRCAQGAISAFLLTEPDVGSDPARLECTATPTDDGAAYLLDGVKLWGTNAVFGELFVVMARVPKSENHRGGITAFIVEADSPGITQERRNAFMGLRGIENAVTRFHQVRVPAANVIGREGLGLKIALTTLNAGRLSIPALAVAASKWALKIAREWSGERVQWGRPVGEHAAVGHKLAAMAGATYAQESVLELAALLADAGAHDIRIEAAIAKLYGSERAWEVIDDLFQIRGGRGYETADSLQARGERAVPVEQVMRDLRINRVFEGSTEIMHLLIAREAVDAHLSVAGDIIDPDAEMSAKLQAAARAGLFYAKWYPQLLVGSGVVPTSFGEYGPLATHMRYIERASRRLARETFYGMARWQGGLEKRQGFLGRVVDIGAELFAMSAMCVRAKSQLDENPAAGESAVKLADAACKQSRLHAGRLFDALWTNTDASDVALAREILDGDYIWAEAGIIDTSEGTGPWISPHDPGPSTEPNLARSVERA